MVRGKDMYWFARAKLHSCGMVFRFCVCAIVILLVAGCDHSPQESRAPFLPVSRAVVTTTTLLAVIAENEKPHAEAANSGQAHGSGGAVRSGEFQIEFSRNGAGVAYLAAVGNAIRVVHNGKAGNPYREMYDYTVTISPDGKRVAYGIKKNHEWFMVVDEKEHGPFADVGPPVFSPDSSHIAYEVKRGEQWQIVVDNATTSPPCSSYFEKPAFSADSTRIAYVENADDKHAMRLIISDLKFRGLSVIEKKYQFIIVHQERSKIAAVIEDENGKKKVVEVDMHRPDNIREGRPYDELANLSFGNEDAVVSYAAAAGGKRYLVLNGREELLPDGELSGPFIIRPDAAGGAVILATPAGFTFHAAFMRDAIREKTYDEAIAVVYSKDGNKHAYAARQGRKWFVVVNGKEGPRFDQVVSHQFSPDGRRLVYRAKAGGKRFVVVSDINGSVIKKYAPFERVFETTFAADGKSLAYGVKDGNRLIWKVERLE